MERTVILSLDEYRSLLNQVKELERLKEEIGEIAIVEGGDYYNRLEELDRLNLPEEIKDAEVSKAVESIAIYINKNKLKKILYPNIDVTKCESGNVIREANVEERERIQMYLE